MCQKLTYISQFINNAQGKEQPDMKDKKNMNRDMKLLLLGSNKTLKIY